MRLIDYKTITSYSGRYKIIYSADIFDDDKGIETTLKSWIDIYEDNFSKNQSLMEYVSSNIKTINENIEVTSLPEDVVTDSNTDRNKCVFLKDKNQTQSKAQSERYDRYVIKSDSGKFIVAYKKDVELENEEKANIKRHLNNYEKLGLYKNYEESVAEYLQKNCKIENKDFKQISQNDPDFLKENPFFVANLKNSEKSNIIESKSKKTKVISSQDSNLNDGEKLFIAEHLNYYEENKINVSVYEFLKENCGIKGREFTPSDSTIPDNEKKNTAFIRKGGEDEIFKEQEKSKESKNELISRSGQSKINFPKEYKLTESDEKVMHTVMDFFETADGYRIPLYEHLNSNVNFEDAHFIQGNNRQQATLILKPKQEVSVKQEPQPYAKKLEEASLENKEEQAQSKQDIPSAPVTPSTGVSSPAPNINVNVNVQSPTAEKQEVNQSVMSQPTVVVGATDKLIQESKTSEKKEVIEKSNLEKEIELTGKHLYEGISNSFENITNIFKTIAGGDAKDKEKTDKQSTTNVESSTSQNTQQLKDESTKIQSAINTVTKESQNNNLSTSVNDTIQKELPNVINQTTTDTRTKNVINDTINNQSSSIFKDTVTKNDTSQTASVTEKSKETVKEKSNLEKEMELTGQHMYESAKNVINSFSNYFQSIFGGSPEKTDKTTETKTSDVNTQASLNSDKLINQIQKEIKVESVPSENKTSNTFAKEVIQSETTPSQESTMMQQATGELTNAIKTVAVNAGTANMAQQPMAVSSQMIAQPQGTTMTLENPSLTRQQQETRNAGEDVPPMFLSTSGQQNQMPAMVSLTNNTISKLASEIVKSMTLTSFLNKGL